MTPPPKSTLPGTEFRHGRKYGPNGVFVGHTVRYPINSVPKPGTQLIEFPKNYGLNGRVRWTGHLLDTGGTNIPPGKIPTTP